MNLLGHSQGVEMIAAERQRQVNEEGWTPEHDAAHRDQELKWAAVHYLGGLRLDDKGRVGLAWPWLANGEYPKPHGPVRDLVRAGALIAAELDRLLGGQ